MCFIFVDFISSFYLGYQYFPDLGEWMLCIYIHVYVDTCKCIIIE